MYLLEHLATFTVSPEMGTLGPRDGMRRLLQMEKTTGIWTQKMELRLRNQSVVIVDHENGVRRAERREERKERRRGKSKAEGKGNEKGTVCGLRRGRVQLHWLKRFIKTLVNAD